MIKKIIRILLDEIKTINRLFLLRLYINNNKQKEIIKKFHILYYDSYLFGGTWYNTFWMGIPVLKCPLDLWVYQEIIYDILPDFIIETGTANGGSALFLASLLDLLNKGKVISIDITRNVKRPKHKRIIYLEGSSTDPEIIYKIKKIIVDSNKKVLVILDSDHSKEHVLRELEIYSQFVSKNSYIIVEDTCINGNPVYPDFGDGPMEAVKDFLKINKNFAIDKSKEKFYLTFNPNGFLKRIK